MLAATASQPVTGPESVLPPGISGSARRSQGHSPTLNSLPSRAYWRWPGSQLRAGWTGHHSQQMGSWREVMRIGRWNRPRVDPS